MEDDERSTAPAPDEVNEAPASVSPGDGAATSTNGSANGSPDQTVASDRSDALTDEPKVPAGPAAAAAPSRSTTSTATASRPPAGKASLKGRGGTAGIFAGVAIIAPVLIRELALGSEPFLLLPVSMIALAVALSGFKVAQGGQDGKLGRIGLIIAVGGALILTIMFAIMAYNDLVLNTRLQSGTWLLQLGFFALLGGILIFGAASLVAGVLTRGPTLLMMVSLVIGLLLDMVGAFPGLRFRWGPDIILGQGMHYGLKVFGLSLIWLGYSILKDTKAKAAVVREA